MRGNRSRHAVIIVAAIVLSVAPVPGLAQSNAVRPRTAVGDDVAVYAETFATPETVDVPANLMVPSNFRATLETMLARSPMFRRQCLRLAAAPHFTVEVRMLHPMTGGPRAKAQIRQAEGGRVIAAVEINPLGDFMELLSHELEHVIEQLDGIDLAARAAMARSGVHSCSNGTFETSRATRVGSLVATEARNAR
jgi:hypothetical protein